MTLLRLAFALALVLLPAAAHADLDVTGGSTSGPPEQVLVSALPACNAASEGSRYTVTDALNASSCSAGGTADNVCVCRDGAYVLEGAALADSDYGDFTVAGGVANVDAATIGSPEVSTLDGSDITDGSLGAADLATDSVSADELNATGVEAELEAVMDLPDMQGAVTDAQVPNTITVDAASCLDVAGARLCYKAADGGSGDCFVHDTNDNGAADAGEQCAENGDHIGTSAGGSPTNGAVVYYARDFDSASSTTDGYQEAVNHCIATMGNLGCVILFGRGTFEMQSQVNYVATEPATAPRNITVKGAGMNRGGGSATRIRFNATLSTANAACDGEEGEVAGPNVFTNEDDPICAGLVVVGWNHAFEDLEFTFASGGSAAADALVEVASRTSAGSSPPADMDVPAVYSTSGTRMHNVLFVDGQLTQLYVSARDGNASSQADHIDMQHVYFQAPNTDVLYNIYVDNENSSQANICRDCLFRGYEVAGLNIRQGEFSLDTGSSEQADGTDATVFLRFCGDLLTDADSSIVGTPACGDGTGVGNMKRLNVSRWHHESESGNGGFLWRDGFSSGAGVHTEVSIRDTVVILFGATAKVIDWDGVGALTLDHFTASNNHAGTNAIEIDCDACSGADQDNQLNLSTTAMALESTDITLTVDMDGSDGIVWEGSRFFDAITQRLFFDTDGDRRPDSGEQQTKTVVHATSCSGVTGGIQGDLCAETDDADLYFCSTATCAGAGWVNTTP